MHYDNDQHITSTSCNASRLARSAQQLLAKEKELTRRRDALNAERRGLPMVRIEKDYVFEGPDGKASLLDLFEDRLQLIIYHFMWLWEAGEPLDKGCPSCSAWTDQIARGHLSHLHARGTSLALVSLDIAGRSA